jgi:hypothetical protein
MNKKLHKTNMILLLVISVLILSACGTLKVEQVEPAAVVELQATLEEPELDEPTASPALEETAVSPTPSPGISNPLPTAIPSTPILEPIPATHNRGSNEIIILPGCFDFDNGVSLTPPDPDCDFNLLPGPDSGTIEMYPIDSAQLAYGSVFPDVPTFTQCADTDAFSTEPELVAPMAAMYICYRTGEDRVGYLHFTDADLEQAYTVTLEWQTFSNDQDNGVVLEEMNLAYQNDIFGFTLPLPEAWQGYTVTQNDYEGVTNICFTFVGSAPTCVLQIDVYSQENWDKLEKVPDGYYLAENNLFVFAAGSHQEECVQLDEFQCARYQEIPTILAGFIVRQ